MAWTKKLEWVAILSESGRNSGIKAGTTGDPEDSHSRYIEAIVNKIVIGCLYLPMEIPWPGPKLITN
jgi:exodeoxyribonuclease-3